jgi:hypothetical protein
MSMLHEFVAAAAGLALGTYYQFTNNLHVYVDRPDCQRLFKTPDDRALWNVPFVAASRYSELSTYPLFKPGEDYLTWLQSNEMIVLSGQVGRAAPLFFSSVAAPILRAHAAYKDDAPDIALKYIADCKAADWRVACTEWLQRRLVGRK